MCAHVPQHHVYIWLSEYLIFTPHLLPDNITGQKRHLPYLWQYLRIKTIWREQWLNLVTYTWYKENIMATWTISSTEEHAVVELLYTHQDICTLLIKTSNTCSCMHDPKCVQTFRFLKSGHSHIRTLEATSLLYFRG